MVSQSRRSMLAAGSWLGAAAAGGISTAPLTAVAAPNATPQCAGRDQDLAYQMIYRRAIEAVLWSMPALSDVFFRESLFRDFGTRPGDVIAMSKPLVARHEVLTANNLVNYACMPFERTYSVPDIERLA